MKCLEHRKQLLFCLIFGIAQQLQLPAASLQTGERNAKNKSHGRYMLSCKSYTWRLTTASIKMTEL